MCCEDRECGVRASVFGHLFTEWSQGLKEESDVHYFWIKKKVFFLSNGCAQGINFKPTWREWKPESNPCAAWIMENANCYSCNTVTSSILHYARPSLFSISCPLFSLASLNYSSYLLSISSPSSANPLSHPALSIYTAAHFCFSVWLLDGEKPHLLPRIC